MAVRFENFYVPKGYYLPVGLETFAHPVFSLGVALFSTVIGLLGIGLAYAWYFRGLGPHGITERNRLARAGHRVLVEKYYLDRLYVDGIAGAIKRPIARAAYWFNQNVPHENGRATCRERGWPDG